MLSASGREPAACETGGYHDVVRYCAEKALVATANLQENVRRRALEAAEFAEAREVCIEVGEKQGLVIVGGEAIDRRLPGIDVYPPGEPGDVDFVTSRSSKLVAATLMNVLRDRGLPASIQPAIHDGTWTVRVHRRVVADVTEVLPRELEVLRGGSPGARGGCPLARGGCTGARGGKRRRRGGGRGRAATPAVTPDGPAVAPVDYLKMSLHLELSRPTSHCKRWPKVYSRMRSLYEAFPPLADGRRADCDPETPPPLPAAASAAARVRASESRGSALLCGVPAALEILGRPPEGRTDVVVLSEDPADTLFEAIAIANEAERLLGGRDVRGGTVLLTTGPSAQGLFLPPFSSVTGVSGEEIVRVYSSALPLCCTECGQLASADAILFLLYGEMLSVAPDLDPGETAGVRSAASSLAAEMLAREDAGDCSGNWRRMVMA